MSENKEMDELKEVEDLANGFIEGTIGKGSSKGRFINEKVYELAGDDEDEDDKSISSERTKLALKAFNKNKAIPIVWIIYALLILVNVKFAIDEVMAAIYVDLSRINNDWYTFVFITGVAVFAWVYSTTNDYWNYYNKKFFGFRFVIITLLIKISSFLYYLSYKLFIPYIKKLTITDFMTEGKIAGLAWIATVLPTMLLTILIFFKVFQGLSRKENKEMIQDFKITHYIGSKSTKYDYTMKFMKYMENGKQLVIGYIDRFLHTNIVGATGTAKTSSIIAPAIDDDLNTKARNEDAKKKVAVKLIRQGRAVLAKPFNDIDFSEAVFNNGLIRPVPGKEDIFKEKLSKFRSAGITAVAPDSSLLDDICTLCEKKKIKYNRIDPLRDDHGKLKKGSRGFNPLYISPLIEDWAIRKEMVKKATLVADVMQYMYDATGAKSDQYFTSVNRIATTTVCMVVMMVHSRVYPGEKGSLAHVRNIINDFHILDNYLKELRAYNEEHGGVYRPIIDIVKNQFLAQPPNGSTQNKFWEHCSGLRIQLNNFLMPPDIERILCSEDTVDLDQMLKDGDVTTVNIELGDLGAINSQCFGLFFMISFINAVLRRKGTERTRLPHFLYVDELPLILCPAMESCYTLFRKFRCAMAGAMQTLDQMDKTTFLKYMKGVILSGCSHHFIFGRATVNDQLIFSRMAGTTEETSYMERYTQNALSSQNPTYTTASQYETKEVDVLRGSALRNKDFQELTCFTVDKGRPLPPIHGKVSFLTDLQKARIKRYKVDWQKLFNNQPVKPELIIDDKAQAVDLNPTAADKHSDAIVEAPSPQFKTPSPLPAKALTNMDKGSINYEGFHMEKIEEKKEEKTTSAPVAVMDPPKKQESNTATVVNLSQIAEAPADKKVFFTSLEEVEEAQKDVPKKPTRGKTTRIDFNGIKGKDQ